MSGLLRRLAAAEIRQALADPSIYSAEVRAEADRLLSRLPDTGDQIRDSRMAARMIAAALAEAARPGQELRARVEALEAKWRLGIHVLDEIDRFEVVDSLRAALEDPR